MVGGGVVFAQVQREPTPLPPEPPQASPFLSGQEPKLTHTVKIYWTTLDNMATKIKVNAEGKRPTQIHCDRSSGDKNVQLFSTISPRCDYNILLTVTGSSEEDKKKFTIWKTLGEGTVTIQIHGFEKEDSSLPPEVVVTYLRNGKVVGESSFTK